MALQVRLTQGLRQSLTMTPQLQQAIKLLQLNYLEYRDAVEQELIENPLLEEIPQEEPSEEEEKKEEVKDMEAYLDRLQESKEYVAPEAQTSFESYTAKAETLQEYLLNQLRLLDTEDHIKLLLAHIIGNLDPDGYLTCEHEELCQSCGCDLDEVHAALEVLKTFEPSGLGARNLGECLLFQLDSMGLGENLVAQIVQKHLDKVERRKFDLIAKEENCSIDEIASAITILQRLEPKPGRSFGADETRYVEPDVYVHKVNGEYLITLNDEGIPRLKISDHYVDLLKGTEQKSYLQEKLKAASWLIKSIHQRQQTIYKVAQSIVKFQTDFLDKGISAMKPLVLKEVAEDVGLHESTVSRVTSNKYIHTPQGVFELKFFFTNGLQNAGGESTSSSSIKERIKQLIANEDRNSPLSDQDIGEILLKENIKIARRTVAKYRESLGIESSSLRKRKL